jgi:hypothetical protein
MKRSLTARGAVTLVAAAGVTVMLSGVSAVSSDNRVAVPAGSSSHVTYTATMTNASEDGCQGATFTSTVTATGSS